jgi:transcriptional regulator with XRE-family HTH domain
MSETLKKLRLNLGWSFRQLAINAGVDFYSVKRAENGEEIQPRTAKKIADALTKEYGREILVTDIEGLNIV